MARSRKRRHHKAPAHTPEPYRVPQDQFDEMLAALASSAHRDHAVWANVAGQQPRSFADDQVPIVVKALVDAALRERDGEVLNDLMGSIDAIWQYREIDEHQVVRLRGIDHDVFVGRDQEVRDDMVRQAEQMLG